MGFGKRSCGYDAHIGKVHFLIGRIGGGIDVRRCGLFRQRRNQRLGRGLLWRPDHDRRNRYFFFELYVSGKIQLNQGLRSRLSSRNLSQCRLATAWRWSMRLAMRTGIGDLAPSPFRPS